MKKNYPTSTLTQKWFSFFFFHISFIFPDDPLPNSSPRPRQHTTVFLILDHPSFVIFFFFSSKWKKWIKAWNAIPHARKIRKMQTPKNIACWQRRKKKFFVHFFFNRSTSPVTRHCSPPRYSCSSSSKRYQIFTWICVARAALNFDMPCLSPFPTSGGVVRKLLLLLLSAVGGGTLLNFDCLPPRPPPPLSSLISFSFKTLLFSFANIFPLNSNRPSLSPFFFSGEFRRFSLRTHTHARRTRLCVTKDLGNSIHVFVSYPSVHNAKTHDRLFGRGNKRTCRK